MSIAEKILRVKDDFDAVYDAGYTKGKAEGGLDSTIGTYVIKKDPYFFNTADFDVVVEGSYHYYDDEKFVKGNLNSIKLANNEEYGDGWILFFGDGDTVECDSGAYWRSDTDPFGFQNDTRDFTLLRTIILTKEITNESLKTWLKENATFTPRTYESGFEDGLNSAVDADKIIKTAATGSGLVSLNDVSEVKHKIAVHTTAGANVTVVGKNFYSGDIQKSLFEDANFKIQNSTAYQEIYRSIKAYLKAGTYTFSASKQLRAAREIRDGVYYTISNRPPYTFTLVNDGYWGISVRNEDSTNWNDDTQLQIEIGSSATAYEKYQTATEHIADSNGIVMVNSISPNMTIISDEYMTVEYRRSWGMQAEYDKFWDKFQNFGNRTNYRYAFYSVNSAAWDDTSYNPKYPIICDTNSSSADSMFYGAMITDTKVDIDISNASGSYTFINCSNLKTIRKLTVSEKTKFNRWFEGCTALENIVFEGLIANDINLQWSTKLTWDSFLSVYDCAYNGAGMTGNNFTVTFARALINRLFETSPGANDGESSPTWEVYEGMALFTIALV